MIFRHSKVTAAGESVHQQFETSHNSISISGKRRSETNNGSKSKLLSRYSSFYKSNNVGSKRLLILRISVFTLLGLLIAAFGTMSFLMLRELETNSFNEVFGSSSDQITLQIDRSLRAKVGVAAVVNHVYSNAIQNGYVGKVPNITLPGFENIMNSLSDLSYSRGISFNPIITNNTRHGWESYAAANVDLLHGPSLLKTRTSNSWIVADGIYNKTASGKIIRNSGYNSKSKYPKLLTPVWQIAPIADNAKAIMYDVHAFPASRTKVIDDAISTKKGGFTDILQLVQDSYIRPSTILYSPVMTLDNENTVVGLSAAIMSWDEVFNDALPSYISGIQCILSTSTTTYTYLLKDGKVIIQGKGDLHDSNFNSHRRDITHSLTTLASLSSADYTISLYPTSTLYDKYITSTPVIASTTGVASALFVVAVLLLYDHWLAKRSKLLVQDLETAEDQSLLTQKELETKKSFVRYISHEIRTPLNTVKMGLIVLEQDILQHAAINAILKTTEDIKNSCDDALEVVNDFLLFDKIATGNLKLELAPMNIMGFLTTAMKPFDIQARLKNIHIAVENELDLQDSKTHNNINIDKYKLTQVIRNVISNSLKFTANYGHITVNVSRLNDTESCTSKFQIKVIDTGVGISMTNQKKLFNEIVQFNPGKLQGGGGSGLGLFISHGIMCQHGGSISVYSAGEGFGSTFTIVIPVYDNQSISRRIMGPSLTNLLYPRSEKKTENGRKDVVLFVDRLSPSSSPRHQQHQHHPAIEDVTGRGEERSKLQHDADNDNNSYFETTILDSAGGGGGNYDNNGSGKDDTLRHNPAATAITASSNSNSNNHNSNSKVRILVVDDSPMNRKMLCRLLVNTTYKYICEEAADGIEALNKVKATIPGEGEEKLFNVILMDYSMPNMNGPEAVRQMRIEGYTGLIVGVTGHTGAEESKEFIDSGADKVIVKPLDVIVLNALIKEYHHDVMII